MSIVKSSFGKKQAFITLGATLALLGGCSVNEPDQQFVTIGTGGVTGVYYPTGGAICRLVNKAREEHGISCSVESTGGSSYNLNTIRAGEMDFGVAQSDVHYQAMVGAGPFEKAGADSELRSVFSVHPEVFTVMAREDANIENFMDLKGKRVNIGNPGSGQRDTMELVMSAFDMSTNDLKAATALKSSEQAQGLCDNKFDAFVFVAGHPNGSIKEASTTCATQLVNVTGAPVTKLVNDHSYFREATIPGNMYSGSPDDTQSFGVAATIVSSTKTSPEVVYQVVKAVFENLDNFRKLHPAFAHLKKEEMIADGLSAPLHEGALRYYQEAGLL